jgi:hypothetical protein
MTDPEAVTLFPETTGDLDEPCAILLPAKEAPREFPSATSTAASCRTVKEAGCLESERGSSTGTDGSRVYSDSLTDSDNDVDVCAQDLPVVDKQLPMLPIHGAFGDQEDGYEPSGFRTPDPLDSMPYNYVPPAFSEAEIAAALAPHAQDADVHEEKTAAEYVPPPPPPPPPPFVTQDTPEIITVPVPVPLPLRFPMPFPCVPNMPVTVPMPLLGMHNAVVPPGYKLVPIPGKSQPSISNPADNDRKIFVGGLSPKTTEISLVEYFSDFGPVEDATVIREANKSRGFGFVQFRHDIPPKILEKKHIIDERRCGVTVAVPRNTER